MAETKTKRISLQTVGCRLNQYETEQMAAEMYRFGFRRVQRGEPADLYIINTCTVTHRADADDRYLIHKAARENPHARIVVAGCYVDADPDLIEGMDDVDVIIANRDKNRIAEILPERLPELFSELNDTGCTHAPSRFQNFNRAWLKVSDGCNQRCAFCILPIVRGDLAHRPVPEVVAEVESFVDEGFREVVLTGLHLGMYRYTNGQSSVSSLAGLCRRILRETDVGRIRLSSIEPQTVTLELMEVFAEAGDRLCRHLHLPLQSGSGRILKAMRRPYTPEQYIHTLRMVRDTHPSMTIGADVIVGFPGETDDDFRQTRHIVQSDLLDYLHVFSYSDRKDTAASKMPEKINPEVIKERNIALSAVSRELKAECHRRQIGQTLGVIAEHKKREKGVFWGIADNYVKVKLPFEYEGGRAIVPYHVTSATDDYVAGELLSHCPPG